MSEQAEVSMADVPDGGSARVKVGDHEVAIFRRGEKFYAITADCPHRGGPLDEGSVLDDGITVSCPWHGWEFDMSTGKSSTHPGEVRCYRVALRGDVIVVEA